MYGSWEATLYNNNYDMSYAQKDELRKQSIKQFNPSTGKLNNNKTGSETTFIFITS